MALYEPIYVRAVDKVGGYKGFRRRLIMLSFSLARTNLVAYFLDCAFNVIRYILLFILQNNTIY